MGKYCLSAIETSGEREREIIFEEILEACPFIVMFGPKTSKKLSELAREIHRRPNMQPNESGWC